MADDFGRNSYVSGFSFRGPVEPEAVKNLIDTIIPAIGMTPIFDAKVFNWTEDGVGFIHVQCLYESCVLADVWPKHQGGYLIVISCKPYDVDIVDRTMRTCGYEALICREFPLWL